MDYEKFPRIVAFCKHEYPTEIIGMCYFPDRFIFLEKKFLYLCSGKSLKCIHNLINEHFQKYNGLIPYFGNIQYYSLQLYEGMNDEELLIFSINGIIRLADEPHLRKMPIYPTQYMLN